MIGIVVVTHGPLAEGLVDSLKFFSGDTSNLSLVSLLEGDSPQTFSCKLQDEISEVDDGEGVIVLADIMGGTPSNQALMLSTQNVNIRVVTGVNLVMMIEAMLSRNSEKNIDILVDKIIESGIESIVNLSKQLSQSQNSDFDDIDQLI